MRDESVLPGEPGGANGPDGPAHTPLDGSGAPGAVAVGGPVSGEPPETLSSVARKLGPFSFLAAFACFMPGIAGLILLSNLDVAGNWLRSHGDAGIALYIVAFMVLAGLAFLPTVSQAVLGGWAFGFVTGFPAALLGFFGGSLIGYGLTSVIGRDRGVRLINQHPKWKAVRDALVGGDEGVGFLKTMGIVALLRLPPNSPFALTNLVMAAAKVPRLPFAIGTLIGMAPRTAAAVYIATLIKGSLSQDAIKEATPWWVLPVGIGSMLVVLGIIGWIANKAVRRVTGMGARSAPPASPA